MFPNLEELSFTQTPDRPRTIRPGDLKAWGPDTHAANETKTHTIGNASQW